MSFRKECVLSKRVMSSHHCYNDLGNQRSNIGVTSGSEETLPSAFRPCEMKVLPNETLDMNRCLYLIIGYLLKGEYGRLGV